MFIKLEGSVEFEDLTAASVKSIVILLCLLFDLDGRSSMFLEKSIGF
jgi:hypothetical protein